MYFAELLQVSLKEDLVYNDYSLFAGNASMFIFHNSGHSEFIYHLVSEWAIHRFFCKVSSLKAMQVELFLYESCLNSCELLMIETKTSFASYCFKEIACNMKVGVSHTMDKRKSLYLPDSIGITSLEG